MVLDCFRIDNGEVTTNVSLGDVDSHNLPMSDWMLKPFCGADVGQGGPENLTITVNLNVPLFLTSIKFLQETTVTAINLSYSSYVTEWTIYAKVDITFK